MGGEGLSKMRIPNLHWCKLLFLSDSLIVSDAFGNECLGLSESLTGAQAREAYQRGPRRAKRGDLVSEARTLLASLVGVRDDMLHVPVHWSEIVTHIE